MIKRSAKYPAATLMAFIACAAVLGSQGDTTRKVTARAGADSARVADSIARLDSAKRQDSLARAVAKTPSGSVTLRASVSERQLHIVQGGEVVRSYPIAVGTASYPTPRGAFRIKKVVWNPGWVPPPNSEWAKKKTAKAPGDPANPMKVVKIFFREPDYYIHGTAEVETLGTAASHGCLRMDPNDAAEVARYVMDHGGQPREEGWFSRLIHLRWKTQTVYLDRPVPLSIGD